MNKLLVALLTVFFALNVQANGSKNTYFKVKLKDGEGLSILLDKYELFDHKVNVTKFYSLNDLSSKSTLLKGKSYLLPIKEYKFDRNTIKTSLKISDLDLVTEIKKYNEKLNSKGLKKSYKKDHKIWVPEHLHAEIANAEKENSDDNKSSSKSEKTEVKKTAVKKETEEVKEDDTKEETEEITSSKGNGEIKTVELFGSKYGKVNMFDYRLKGQVFYISSGHGGPDPGSQCTDLEQTLCEDEYAYDVSLRLARDLMQHGATVHVIVQDKNDGIRDDAFLDCDYDESCNGKKLPIRQLDRLKQRADQINRLHSKYKKQGVKKQTAIMIHVDSNNKEHSQDVFFYHNGRDARAKDLAYDLKSTFEEKYEIFQKGRGYKGHVSERGLYMVRKVNPSAIFVELANIRNKSDHIRLMQHTNRQALANWLFEGLTGIK